MSLMCKSFSKQTDYEKRKNKRSQQQLEKITHAYDQMMKLLIQRFCVAMVRAFNDINLFQQ